MKNKKKGFTLIELIIVLVIVGILIAILVPSWGYFMRRARERTANAKAKVIFSAAQTEVSRIAQKERTAMNFVHDTTNDTVERGQKWGECYMGDYYKTLGATAIPDYRDFYFYWDGTTGMRCDKDGNSLAVPSEDARFANAINNISGSEGTYKIYVKNYRVRAVVYSNYADGRYKGTYPRTMGTDTLTDAQEETVRNTDVSAMSMTAIRLADAIDDADDSAGGTD